MTEKNETEKKNPAHQILDRLTNNSKSLHIARLPDDTKKKFIELASREFCDDYGMCLKWLMDDIISGDMKLMIESIEELKVRIHNLEQIISTLDKQPKEKPTGPKMCDGKTLNRGKRT